MNLDELLALKAQRPRPIIVVHCGSTTRAREAFAEWQLKDTLAGKIVLTIGAHKNDAELGIMPEQAVDLDCLHLAKIERADEVLILNVGGYLGESTRRELEYAQRLGKQIRWLEPPMQFEKISIIVSAMAMANERDIKQFELEAWQGVGTGLAYHHPVCCDEEYSLTHIPTGRAITTLTVPTESEAQAWLQAVAAIDSDRWNISMDEYIHRYRGRGSELRARIESAYDDALTPLSEV